MKSLILVGLVALASCAPAPDNEAAAGNVEADGTAAPATNSANTAAQAPAPAATPAPPTATGPYTAHGQEPGWALTIGGGRLDYVGDYGETKINVASPEPQIIANGRRYATDQLTVEIKTVRCNDAMSGQGFEDEVAVTAGGETYQGCGGTRRADWDM